MVGAVLAEAFQRVEAAQAHGGLGATELLDGLGVQLGDAAFGRVVVGLGGGDLVMVPSAERQQHCDGSSDAYAGRKASAHRPGLRAGARRLPRFAHCLVTTTDGPVAGRRSPANSVRPSPVPAPGPSR
ncbi:hypothetical protein GCM10010505_46900 [Kitasatospora aburaviensis]